MPSRDIWALGVCLYCFMFGRVPFIDHTLIDVYNKIKNDPYLVPPLLSTAAQTTNTIMPYQSGISF